MGGDDFFALKTHSIDVLARRDPKPFTLSRSAKTSVSNCIDALNDSPLPKAIGVSLLSVQA